jgi:hypothetical protein
MPIGARSEPSRLRAVVEPPLSWNFRLLRPKDTIRSLPQLPPMHLTRSLSSALTALIEAPRMILYLLHRSFIREAEQ